MKRLSATLGGAAHLTAKTRWGRALGVAAYEGIARVAAAALSRIPGVEAVYATGSLTRPARLDPGRSDIDLVVACSFCSVERERETLHRLAEWQRRMQRLGGLFYNLDCLATAEVPYARAFGGAWETRFDDKSRALFGPPLPGRARRPAAELSLERFSLALRRWLNTGARLLDPAVLANEPKLGPEGFRLLVDVLEAWTELDLTRTDSWQRVRDLASTEGLTFLSEVAGSGPEVGPNLDLRNVVLPATLQALNAFARQVSAHLEHPLTVEGEQDPFRAPAALEALAHRLLRGPFDTVVLLHRGPSAKEMLPVAIGKEAASVSEVLGGAARAFADCSPELADLRHESRRPVPLSADLWRAAALLEPAPFTGATALRPLFSRGEPAPLPLGPSPTLRDALLRARVVQSFSLCRGPELRPRWSAARRARTLADRYALLPALYRALQTGTLDVGWTASPHALLAPEERIRILRAFSEYHRQRLAPLLAGRV